MPLLIVPLFLFGLVAFALIAYVISIYNGLIRLKENIAKAWANIDVSLKQRRDELGKLLEVVKGAMQYEKGLIEEIVRLRETESKATTVAETAVASAGLSKNITALFARAEAYPDLKANTSFVQFQNQISAIENQISDRREFYNDSVNQYNIRIQSVPDVFLAGLLGMQKMDLFKVSEEDKQDVEIKLS